MNRILKWVFSIFIFVIIVFIHLVNSETKDVKQSLVHFTKNLSAGSTVQKTWGWNMTSDPCIDKWEGVSCDSNSNLVRKIILDDMNLRGVFDAASLCRTTSLAVLSLNRNNIGGLVQEEIGNCKQLTHIYLRGNQLFGGPPESLSKLNNLKRFDIADNNFSGKLPDISRVSGLLSFLVENNKLVGGIPDFDFSNILDFNVSNNNLSGLVPDVEGKFSSDSFAGNPGLCGKPLVNSCPPPSPSEKKLKRKSSDDQYLIYSGYGFLGLIVLVFIGFKLTRRNKKSKREAKIGSVKKEERVDSNSIRLGHKSEYSISAENGTTSSSLAVLTSPLVTGMRFEDLLQAPAELLGRGKHGSLYKVQLDNGVRLVVKRIKDWKISGTNFKRRMQRLDQVRHPYVLPAVAFYCSKQEKLLVYEFQPNNSLFNLLHGSQNGEEFDWGSRLNVAASVAEALTFMHHDLLEDGVAHGNLKSTNILFDKDMDPHISEYGLMLIENEEQSLIDQSENSNLDEKQSHRGFKMDVYGFGVILLELLTGRLVQNNGVGLARWVDSVVREEWTGEVFDKSLMEEGASEERMVNLLQVALKCITIDPSERPSIDIVAVMINSIKEEEERSISSDL